MERFNKTNIHLPHIFLLLLSVQIMACGTETGTEADSCFPFEMDNLETAEYSFSQANKTERLSIAATVNEGGESSIRYSIAGQSNSMAVPKCEKYVDTELPNKVFYLVHNGFLWLPPELSEQEIVYSNWREDCIVDTQMITVAAGTYSVEKCTLTPSDGNLNITSIVRYTKDFGDNIAAKPFAGIIKQTVNFKDGTNAVVELQQWNSR